MKKIIIAAIVTAISITGVTSANAQTKLRPNKTVTMSTAQFEQLITSIQSQKLAVPERGERGEQGSSGAQGERGLQGERGAAGERGVAGPKGDKGDKGDVGDSGIPSGSMLLFQGDCPTGWATNGWTHKWAVYNVKIDGRPWTSGGDQLTLTACIKN